MFEFKLGHAFDVTDYYKEVTKNNGEGSPSKYFVGADVWDFHVWRIIEGFNSEYEREPRTKLLECLDINKYEIRKAFEEKRGRKYHWSDIRNFPDELHKNLCYDPGNKKFALFKDVIDAIIECDEGDNDDLEEYRNDTDI